MKRGAILGVMCAGVIGLLAPQAKADAWNQKTTFTFSQPVEIPGQVLSPGTYVFKLLDSQSDRDIVQVFNKRESRLYGTFLAIPDYHLTPSGRPIITFEERAAGAPAAVKAWFYPGDNFGHEFVYPKVKAMELAKVNNEPVPSMPNEMAEQTKQPAPTKAAPPVVAMGQTPLKAEKPNQEVSVAEAFPPPPANSNTNQTAQEPAPNTLPKTASDLPLIGLLGFLSLAGAGLLTLPGRARRSTTKVR